METVARARLVVARLLGGSAYWPYGVERLVETCRAHGIPLALLPGDDKPDPELARALDLAARAVSDRLWRYLAEGGPANADNFLALCRIADRRMTTAMGRARAAAARRAVLARIARCRASTISPREWRGDGGDRADRVLPGARAVGQHGAGRCAGPSAVGHGGCGRCRFSCTALRMAKPRRCSARLFAAAPPAVILNATGFSVARRWRRRPAGGADCPVLQVVFAGGDEESWRTGTRGLGPRDLAMNVALPEIDGRILSRAVSFKAPLGRDPETEADLVGYRPVADRIAFVADLARNWARLRAQAAGRTAGRADPRQLPEPRRPHRQRRRPRHAGLGDRDPAGACARPATGSATRRDDAEELIAPAARRPDQCATPARRPRNRCPSPNTRPFSRRLPPAVQQRGSGALGRRRARPVLPPGTARLRPFRDPRLPRRQCRGADPAGARLQHRPEIDLSRSGAGAAARLFRRLCLARRGVSRRRGHPSRQARHPRMAARKGAGLVGRMLPGGGARAACRISIRSSSTIRARARRPSGARRRSSSTI